MFMTSNYCMYLPYVNACTLVYMKENSAFYSSTVFATTRFWKNDEKSFVVGGAGEGRGGRLTPIHHYPSPQPLTLKKIGKDFSFFVGGVRCAGQAYAHPPLPLSATLDTHTEISLEILRLK